MLSLFEPAGFIDNPSPQRFQVRRDYLTNGLPHRVASASVRDGISAAAVVFAPDYGSEDYHRLRSRIFSRDCAGSSGPDSLASAA
jgi:hypothetical protein